MEATPTPDGFDYQSLETGLMLQILDARDELHSKDHRSSRDIIAIGEQLRIVKGLLPHGQFGPWLRIEFGWTDRTARRFMAVTEMVEGKSDNVSRFAQPSALYLLASNAVPDAVRDEFVDRAGAGEPVRHRDVQDRLREVQRGPVAADDTPAGLGADDGAQKLDEWRRRLESSVAQLQRAHTNFATIPASVRAAFATDPDTRHLIQDVERMASKLLGEHRSVMGQLAPVQPGPTRHPAPHLRVVP